MSDKGKLISDWLYAKNNFMHHAISYMYKQDEYRYTVTSEERQHHRDRADFWYNKMNNIRDLIHKYGT